MTTTEHLTPTSLKDVLGDEGGVEHKHLYTTPSGKRWLGKTTYVENEFDHYVVLKAAGLRTPDIGRRTIDANGCCDSGTDELLIEWLDNAVPLADYVEVDYTKENYIEGLRIAIVDYLTDNCDRHPFNMLFDKGSIIPIDGGHAFMGWGLSLFKQYLGDNPIATLFWDSLTDTFSLQEVMTITAEVIRSVRDVVEDISDDAHRLTVKSRLSELSRSVLDWYRAAARKPSYA